MPCVASGQHSLLRPVLPDFPVDTDRRRSVSCHAELRFAMLCMSLSDMGRTSHVCTCMNKRLKVKVTMQSCCSANGLIHMQPCSLHCRLTHQLQTPNMAETMQQIMTLLPSAHCSHSQQGRLHSRSSCLAQFDVLLLASANQQCAC